MSVERKPNRNYYIKQTKKSNHGFDATGKRNFLNYCTDVS